MILVPCKTTMVHYMVYGATNKAAWDVKLLLMTVSVYQVDCGILRRRF